ncbi:unnamed protein product [Toxocara canis]|uniref:UV excision repair protein RAD23 n=1 Tax=Toxocara canis TaxID=6265 RepID=A0A183U903_TOXCA|nr:unnamed protein product [Toxocara canis]
MLYDHSSCPPVRFWQHEEGEPEESAGEESGQGLEFLRQLPQFEQLRELVQSNPAILPQIIQQIAQSNPALMEAIQNNQEQFVNLLNAPSTEGSGHGGTAPGEGATQPHAQPRGIAIEVTAAERDAINRVSLHLLVCLFTYTVRLGYF